MKITDGCCLPAKLFLISNILSAALGVYVTPSFVSLKARIWMDSLLGAWHGAIRCVRRLGAHTKLNSVIDMTLLI